MQKAREEAAEYSLGSRESPSSNGVVWLLEPGWQSPGVTEATEAVVYNPGEGQTGWSWPKARQIAGWEPKQGMNSVGSMRLDYTQLLASLG